MKQQRREFDGGHVRAALEAHPEQLRLWNTLRSSKEGLPLVKTLSEGEGEDAQYQFKHLSFQEGMYVQHVIEDREWDGWSSEAKAMDFLSDAFNANVCKIGGAQLGEALAERRPEWSFASSTFYQAAPTAALRELMPGAMRVLRSLDMVTSLSSGIQAVLPSVALGLKAGAKLQVLGLGDGNWADQDGEEAMEALGSNTTLTTLRCESVTSAALGAGLGQALSKNTTLTSLSLERCERYELTPILEALHSNRTLQEFKHEGDSLASGHSESLRRALEGNTSITSLGLTFSGSAAGAIVGAIVAALRGNTALRQLDLANNRLQEKVVELAEALKENATVEALLLADNYVPDEAGAKLARALQGRRLRKLSLAGNGKLGPLTGAALCEALRHSEEPQCELNLTDCWKIGEEAAVGLATMLRERQGVGSLLGAPTSLVLDSGSGHSSTQELLTHALLVAAELGASTVARFILKGDELPSAAAAALGEGARRSKALKSAVIPHALYALARQMSAAEGLAQGGLVRVRQIALGRHTARHMTLTADGSRILAPCEEQIKVFDLLSAECVLTIDTGREITGLCEGTEGHRIISGGKDLTVMVHDAQSGSALLTLRGHTAEVWAVCATSDGAFYASGGGDQTVKLWDTQSGRCVHTLGPLQSTIRSVGSSRDGKHVFAGESSGVISVWQVGREGAPKQLKGHSDFVRSCFACADGKRLLSASDDATVRVWDLDSGRCVRQLSGHTHLAMGAIESPDGRHIVSASCDSTVRVWDAETGECELVLEGHSSQVCDVAMSGSTIVSVDDGDKTSICIWQLQGRASP